VACCLVLPWVQDFLIGDDRLMLSDHKQPRTAQLIPFDGVAQDSRIRCCAARTSYESGRTVPISYLDFALGVSEEGNIHRCRLSQTVPIYVGENCLPSIQGDSSF
jgi:hypothetical protein